jgi:hypothetical protein
MAFRMINISDVNPEKLLDTQVSSWVENLCRSHAISDATFIAASKKKVKHYIVSHMDGRELELENITPLLAEALKTLNKQLDSNSGEQEI